MLHSCLLTIRLPASSYPMCTQLFHVHTWIDVCRRWAWVTPPPPRPLNESWTFKKTAWNSFEGPPAVHVEWIEVPMNTIVCFAFICLSSRIKKDLALYLAKAVWGTQLCVLTWHLASFSFCLSPFQPLIFFLWTMKFIIKFKKIENVTFLYGEAFPVIFDRKVLKVGKMETWNKQKFLCTALTKIDKSVKQALQCKCQQAAEPIICIKTKTYSSFFPLGKKKIQGPI